MTHDQKIELLTLLKEFPMSTTAFLFKAACETSGSQIPDPSALSKIIYTARGRGLLTTSDAGKTKVHKITGKGVEELMGNEQNNTVIVDNSAVLANAPGRQKEENNNIEIAFDVIRAAIAEAKNKKTVVIERKEQKISTLLRLGALMSDDIKVIFDEIISDLERL
jgi:hypothetical protein